MKLLQCNIEGRKHITAIKNFISLHNPDVICLQEADEKIITVLKSSGYTISFMPILKRSILEGLIDEGVVLAARNMKNIEEKYYYFPLGGITVQDSARHRATTAHGYIMADCVVGTEIFRVCTTHFTWTARGDIASEHQKEDMKSLLSELTTQPPHILCGDFNIPRGFNPLYQDLARQYVDTIPKHFTSSLDKTFHRMGGVASRSHLFSHYMVDYIFTKPPYRAENVELIFGVSDHAAVVAEVFLE